MISVQQGAADSGSILDTVSNWLNTALGVSPGVQAQLFFSLIILVGVRLLRRLVLRLVRRRVEDPRALYQWGKVSSYLATLTAVLLIGPIWLEGVGSLGTFLGLLTAGLAIALREPVANLAGWGFILWRRPFELGDRIQIGDVSGDVVDISVFQFTLLEIGNWVDADQSTGRIVHVPNARLFAEPIANSTAEFPYIWNEVPVLITFESDADMARSVIEEIVRELASPSEEEVRKAMKRASEKFMIFYQNVTPIVYMSVRDSGVLLTARYMCDPRTRRGSAEAIWSELLRRFADSPELELAYPTYRIVGDGSGPSP